MVEPVVYGADFVGCILRNVFGWFWGMWGLVSGQDETCSVAKYDVSVGVNHVHLKRNSRGNGKQAEFI